MSLCECCIKPCSKIFQPICGKIIGGAESEKQTFENACLMENWNCENASRPYEKISDGECSKLGPVKFANN